MDDGICIVFSIMGSYDGTHNIRYRLIAPAAVVIADRCLVQHLLSGPRLPFTAAYFGSIAMTLYFSIGVSDRPFLALCLPLLDMAYPSVQCFLHHTLLGIPPFLEIQQRHFARFAMSKNASLLTDWVRVTLQLQQTILTLIAAIVQMVCLVWYLVSYFPMGSTGLRFAARFGGNRITAWMNE